jgi:C_GCAxxG_C_C family probable redox protein
VLLPWAGELGLDEATAARVAAPFAAGMRLGSLCGAVTGALIVIGLATCSEECGTRQGRSGTIAPIAEFSARFSDRFGSLDCPDIIGCDLRDPETMRRAAEEGLFGTLCAPAVGFAAEVLDDLLQHN